MSGWIGNVSFKRGDTDHKPWVKLGRLWCNLSTNPPEFAMSLTGFAVCRFHVGPFPDLTFEPPYIEGELFCDVPVSTTSADRARSVRQWVGYINTDIKEGTSKPYYTGQLVVHPLMPMDRKESNGWDDQSKARSIGGIWLQIGEDYEKD